MKTTTRNMLLIAGIIICLVGGIAGGMYWYEHDNIIFEGKEIFQTEEDYTTFKLEIIQEDCEIIELSELSSEYPVVVNFRVKVPNNYEFAYGKYSGTTKSWSILAFLIIPVVIATLVYLVPDKKE